MIVDNGLYKVAIVYGLGEGMFRSFAVVYGVVFLFVGVTGFISALTPNEHLFGIFKVNTALNIIHLITAAFALWMVFVQRFFQRTFFQVIGFIYAIIAILGFIYADSSILGFMANNAPDTWFHVIAAVTAMILGFGTTNTLEDS